MQKEHVFTVGFNTIPNQLKAFFSSLNLITEDVYTLKEQEFHLFLPLEVSHRANVDPLNVKIVGFGIDFKRHIKQDTTPLPCPIKKKC